MKRRGITICLLALGLGAAALGCADGGPGAEELGIFEDTGAPPPADAGTDATSPPADTGAPPGDTGPPPPPEDAGEGDAGPGCGNGRIDPGETCDGDCPEECVSSEPCMRATRTGSVAGCSVVCTFMPDERDTDGDSRLDCIEEAEGTDPTRWNGLTMQIGDSIGFTDTGSCDNFSDYSEMLTRFDPVRREQDLWAGWEYDTGANNYTDPGYNADPPWEGGGDDWWQGRFTGRIYLAETGRWCFSVDTGASNGNLLTTRRNGCGQVWVDTNKLGNSGLDGDTSPSGSCMNFSTGWHDLDIVARHRNSGVENAKLVVRHCFGGSADCTPDQPLTPAILEVPL